MRSLTELKPLARSSGSLILLCVLAAVAWRGVAQAETYEEHVAAGKGLLDAGRYEQAFAEFRGGLTTARLVGEREREADFLFYQALTRQRQSEEDLGPGEYPPEWEESDWNPQRVALRTAARLYTEMLRLRPDSGPALNNLAQVRARLGQPQRARDLYQRAITLEDGRQGIYATNLADLLADIGDESATEYYKIAAVQTANSRAHETVAEELLAQASEDLAAGGGLDDSEGLLAYLWELVETRKTAWARDAALDALDRVSWGTRGKRRLLAIVVAALGEQSYDPVAFLQTETADRLRGLSWDDDVGRGAAEVLLVHQAEQLAYESFDWWAGSVKHERDPKRGVWGQDAFLSLVRSIGDWYHEAGDAEQAKQYYFVAGNLDSFMPDPEAYLRLADLYVEQGDLAGLKALMTSGPSEEKLFHGKAEVYRTSRLRRIYDYHCALGVIYSHLGRWEDTGPASAIFQLERAVDVAHRLNCDAPVGAVRVDVEPRIVEFLSTGYEARGWEALAVEVRIEAAERYVRQGSGERADRVLAPVRNEEALGHLDTGFKDRFHALPKSLHRIDPP